MQQKKLIQALVCIGFTALLGACSGGGGSGGTGSNSGAGTPAGATGTVNMAVTDGPSENFSHVWVTITGMAMHTESNAVWSSSDATWTPMMLAAPVTIDLAQLDNGALNNLFNGITLPVGTYKQIRFFLLGDEDPLAASASATASSLASSLTWNDQVEYTNSSGQTVEAPLEIAQATQGLRLDGSFVVTAGSTLNLATDFDLDKIVVPFHHANVANPLSTASFTMKPDLAYFNMNSSGAVTGQVNATALCPATNGIITAQPATTCAFNLIAHAERLSADGTRYEAVRSTRVDPTTGAFTLAPLPVTDELTGQPITYDIVVRGRQMQTLVITGVQPSGTYTYANSAESFTGGTSLSASALPVTLTNEYPTNFALPLQPLTSGHAVFEQTFPNGTSTLPHEIRWAATNPYTGNIDRTFMAPWNQAFYVANAGLNVAPYSAGGLSFAAVTPSEGNGNYNVQVNEHVYYDFGANYLPTANLLTNLSGGYPVANGTTTVGFSYNAPVLDTGVVSGTVSGTISGTLSPKTSNSATVLGADVVLARNAAVISTVPVNSLSPSCSSGGNTLNNSVLTNCSYQFSGVGAGSMTAPLPGAYYYVYLRVFYSDGSHKSFPVSGYADLRTTNSASMSAVTTL